MSTHTPTWDGTVLLSPADAARLAQVSRETIYREIDRGELPARHVGRQLRIDPAELHAYLNREGRPPA
jgi:putative molybdopterin biosynthesis protein